MHWKIKSVAGLYKWTVEVLVCRLLGLASVPCVGTSGITVGSVDARAGGPCWEFSPSPAALILSWGHLRFQLELSRSSPFYLPSRGVGAWKHSRDRYLKEGGPA